MPLPQPRKGQLLRIKDRPLEFSFWPMERTTRRYGLGTRLFATDPWTAIRRSAERRCIPATRDAAFALLEQAEDFSRAAESGVKAAKPLLLYYCMMNLAKAFILSWRQRQDVNNAKHGLSERLDPPHKELVNAWLNADRTAKAKIQVFDEFLLGDCQLGTVPNPRLAAFDLQVTRLSLRILPIQKSSAVEGAVAYLPG